MEYAAPEIARQLAEHKLRNVLFQIAGVPERHEPDTGEINYRYLFRLLDQLGYEGWLGCEYRPANGTEEGLGWMRNT